MTTTDIKSHIWITYQSADNSVWARIKNPYHDNYINAERAIFNKKYGEITFPILNTTEIGLEIRGEDLEIDYWCKVGVDKIYCGERIYNRLKEIGKSHSLKDYEDVGIELRYTPNQTPKIDNVELRKETKYYSDHVEDIIDLLYTKFYEPISHEQWFRDKQKADKDEAFYEWLNEQIKNANY